MEKRKKPKPSGGTWLQSGNSRRSKSSGQQEIRYDRYFLSRKELLLGIVKGVAICALLAYTFYRSMKAFYVMLPFGLLFPVEERRRLKEKRLFLLAQQFKESMIILAASLSAGFSLENALVVSREELVMLYGEDGMITQEFAGMVQQVRMNRAVEQALADFARRSSLEDVRNFSEVFSVAKRSGGDLSSIMRHTAEILRDKMQVREEIRTMTASRQFEQKIMNLIPFFIVFYIEGSSPGFFDLMYGTGLGRILMTGCLAVYVISFLMAKKILDIEV